MDQQTLYEKVAARVMPLPHWTLADMRVACNRKPPATTCVYLTKQDFELLVRRLSLMANESTRGTELRYGPHSVNWHAAVKPGQLMFIGKHDGVDGCKLGEEWIVKPEWAE